MTAMRNINYNYIALFSGLLSPTMHLRRPGNKATIAGP